MPEHESDLPARITIDPGIFGGKPIIRGHRLAVGHVAVGFAWNAGGCMIHWAPAGSSLPSA